MIFSQLFSNPALVVMWVVGVLYAITVHEFSHALAAKLQGDPTPESQGRLSFNPLVHIDPMGFIMLLFIGFGWGKPVVFDERQLRHPRLGAALVGLAGPLSNLLSVILFGFLTRFFLAQGTPPENLMIQFFVFLILLNTTLMVFNLIPIPPLDGSHVLLAVIPDRFWVFKGFLITRGPVLLFGLVILDMATNGRILSPVFSWFQYSVFRILGA